MSRSGGCAASPPGRLAKWEQGTRLPVAAEELFVDGGGVGRLIESVRSVFSRSIHPGGAVRGGILLGVRGSGFDEEAQPALRAAPLRRGRVCCVAASAV